MPRAQLAVAESRFQAYYDKLPTAPFDRIQARVRWLNLESRVFYEMHDWAQLERVTRATLAAIDEGLSQRPNDSELLLRRAVTQTFLGIALLRQNNAPEAVSVLEQAVTGYHDTPPAMAFTDNRGDLFQHGHHESCRGTCHLRQPRPRKKPCGIRCSRPRGRQRKPINLKTGRARKSAQKTWLSLPACSDPTKTEEAGAPSIIARSGCRYSDQPRSRRPAYSG